MATVTRVLVACGDADLADRVAAVLTCAGFDVCCSARSTASGLVLARAHRHELVLLEGAASGDVEPAIREIHDPLGGQVVVLLTGIDDSALADLMLAGAAGAVMTDDLHTLPASLRGVLDGEPALSRRLFGRLLVEYRAREDAAGRVSALAARLSPREREVLEHLRRGHTTLEIARALTVEPVTVRTHIASALRKLHVHCRAEAVRALAGPPAPDRTHLSLVAGPDARGVEESQRPTSPGM